MSSADELPVSMGAHYNYYEAIHTRFSGSIMPKVIKPSNPFTNVCWVSVLTTFSAPPQILAASAVLLPDSRNRSEPLMVSLVLLLPVVLNSKRLLSTSCNKQGQRSSE